MKIEANLLCLLVCGIVFSPVSAFAAPKAEAPSAVPLSSVKSDVEIPSSVQDVVDKLNGASKDVTLDDLNEAREAVAKLEVLLDIEKKLKDLAKIRQERETVEVGTASVMPMIPAAALQPPPSPVVETQPSTPLPPPVYIQPVKKGPEEYKITRISGMGGRYVASYDEDGVTNKVSVGDKMPDGSHVVSISQRGVVVSKDSKQLVLPVKGVGRVFGAQ